jgi:hypothetical protein
MKVVIPLGLDALPDRRRTSLLRLFNNLGWRLKRTDPVSLPVSRVRAEILGLTEGSWRAGVSSSVLGQIFHQCFADLFTATHEARWQRVLTPADLDDPALLARHVYRQLAGPRLVRQQAALQEFTQELLNFWDAIQSMCGWFCGVLKTALDEKQIRYDDVTGFWVNADTLVRPEQDLYWELRDDTWSAPVRVEGRADAVIRKPGTNEWCVLEYKLGGASPEADLAQVCLYHGMLTQTNQGEGTVAMLYFHPSLRQQVFATQSLEPALRMLKPLIGRLAGVAPSVSASRPEVRIAKIARAGVGPVDSSRIEPVDPMGAKVLDVCREFGANARLVGPPVVGPTFCRYAIEPARGVPAKKFQGLALDLQVRLGLDAPPLIGVHGGQLVVDVQRRDRQQVLFSEIHEQIAKSDMSSRMPVGVDLNGVLRFVDLSNPLHAHVLVAGTSGSGKTEWLRSAIAGMMIANTPETLRLVLIDPKRAAFGDLKGSPFLYQPDSLVYPEGPVTPIAILDALIEEMESRYRAHQRAFVDDLRQFIDKTGEKRARIVCVCDEYADLVSGDRKLRRELEGRISRLGAKARAAGIHLVIATQRPSRDIVSGALQANMTCRVAMKTQSAIESRLLLGQSGAEHLLGHGDLLFQDIQDPVRLQAPLLSESDRKAIFQAS